MTTTTLFNLLLCTVLCVIHLSVDTSLDNSEPIDGDFNMFDPINIPTSFPIILFAAVYHTFLPSIVENVEHKPKAIRATLTRVLIVSLIIYISVGLVIPSAIPDVKGFFNISFRNYSAGNPQNDRPSWTYFMAYFIVLFPSIGILSTYPLMTISIAHNLITYFFGVDSKIAPRLAVVGLKLVTVLIPLSIAFFEYDLVISI